MEHPNKSTGQLVWVVYKGLCVYSTSIKEIEVIGNVYDNPELLRSDNCLHYELCRYNTFKEAHYFGKDKEIYITIDNNSHCKYFANRSEWVHLPCIQKKNWRKRNELRYKFQSKT